MKPQKRPAPERPRQDVGRQIVDDLLGVIRGQFYPDAKSFYQDRAFLQRNVVLWPAKWLDQRGVTLPPARYKEILLEVFTGIKQHGQTGAVRYWPGYLMKCVQDHFKHHGEDYYEEGKSVRNLAERAVMAAALAGKDRPVADDSVRQLAKAQALVALPKRQPKPKQLQNEPCLPGL
jgi:hypothetical protein